MVITKKLMLVVLGTAAFTSCIKPSAQQGAKKGSNLVSVSMKMPTKIGDKDVSSKLNIYNLKVQKKGGDCSFIDIEKMEKVSSSDVKIDASLKQGCDYAISLAFGFASSDGSKMEKIYLSNEAHDDLPANPTLVKKEELEGKTTLNIKSCVPVTLLGATDLGVEIGECPSIANNSTDATIEPVIPQPQASQVKLSDKIKAEIKSETTGGQANLLIEGKIQSTQSKDQYCAIMHAVSLTDRQVIYSVQSEGLMKIEANMMLDVKKTVTTLTADQRTARVDKHQLFVKCFDTLDSTKKTEEVLKDCKEGKCKEIN